ncbi:enoyl-CoA hydratase/carnithine racemase [Saccharopolyspora lacisalsi]|uniref:Enoyl-CoA hydratase/carnithine racemase n=1 Tax=Halosaccharopolyspora lacisalsi TaxID=1000566 RepID=A0A839DT67_9PSEU|nr:enoyl-CoA hydratase-related protein [Halosaccharopolyspora lacisalsi]MBA8823949.1 enoyl-CoA hydratase/carnithine racemase [Halosaccharopolyspora lacisalsi]
MSAVAMVGWSRLPWRVTVRRRPDRRAGPVSGAPQVAMEPALTGDMLAAQRAHEVGLVNKTTEDGCALTEALALAGRIAANGPLATVASKRIVLDHEQWPKEERFSRQRAITDPVFASEDAREGIRAFAEKRRPHWQSR